MKREKTLVMNQLQTMSCQHKTLRSQMIKTTFTVNQLMTRRMTGLSAGCSLITDVRLGSRVRSAQDWKCPLLHPKICNYLYLHGSCYRTGCKERHTKDHQTPKKITEDQDNQSFLWQKQIQEQIDKLAYTTQQIFQALNQSQQRPVPIWNQTLPQQTLQPPLQPGWTYSQ